MIRSHAAGNEHLPDELAAEPWSEDAARWRLDRLPVDVPPEARFLGGNSNDAWVFRDRVLRVCWRADRDRLLREAELLQALPAAVPHADVLEAGADDEVSWVLSTRLPGRPLLEVITGLPAERTRALFTQLARALRTLHDWAPPTALRERLTQRPRLEEWQTDLVPLPMSRMAAVAATAARVPGVDRGLVGEALRRIEDLADHDPFAGDPSGFCVVHGDATIANVLVEDGVVTGLIDFEYARLGPRDLELLSPVLFGQGFGVSWWREDYQELFEAADLRERLWLYELCCALRGVAWWPPDGAAEEHPPITTLRRLVAAPSPW